jgi:hypothetical protein
MTYEQLRSRLEDDREAQMPKPSYWVINAFSNGVDGFVAPESMVVYRRTERVGTGYDSVVFTWRRKNAADDTWEDVEDPASTPTKLFPEDEFEVDISGMADGEFIRTTVSVWFS